MTKNVMLLWAGGKESLLAYKRIIEAGDTISKLAVITDEGKSVLNGILRGVRTQRSYIPIEIIQAQADALGIELIRITINDIQSMSQYYDSLAEWGVKCQAVYEQFKAEGGTHVAFGYTGSLCLESKNVGQAGLEVMYPLLNINEDDVINELSDGYKFRIVRTSASVYGYGSIHDVINKDWNAEIANYANEKKLSKIGEDGSFSTLCYESPYFTIPIKFGDVLEFKVDDMMRTAKLSDLNAFNVIQLGAIRRYVNTSL